MIEVEHLRKSYGTKVALENLSLTVGPGVLYSFLGPNGAGKTTTIRTLIGLLRPDLGTVRICGFDIQRQTKEAKRWIGYIPDQPYLYDKLTGREFLRFIGSMYGMSQADIDRKIGEVGEVFEVLEFLDDLCEGYSHGMRQRVVFCSALLHSPKVLVVDEPMVGLDPKGVRTVKDVFRRQAAAGVSIFVSTHTLASAQEISDRIGIISKGRLIAEGTVSEICQKVGTAESSLEDAFLTLTG